MHTCSQGVKHLQAFCQDLVCLLVMVIADLCCCNVVTAGTFNGANWTAGTSATCTACPGNTTTDTEGTDSVDGCDGKSLAYWA